VVVALKIFFRFLLAKGRIERDPTETLTLPRIERYLPETLNELQVQQLIESINTTQPLGLRDRAIIELPLRERAPDLGAGERAAGELQRRAADPARDGQREQDAARAGGTESVRSAGGVRLGGTTEAGEGKNGSEIFLSSRGTKLTTVRPLADRERTRARLGVGSEHLPASPAA
jgi:integrase/recombinase XerD